MPNKVDIKAINNKYNARVFLPRIFFKTAIDDAFVVGPAIKKTKAAPGVMPFAIIAKAIGIDAVAHT